MDTQDISSPEYFQATYKVDAPTANELSRQANFVGRERGGGITAEAPAGPTPASAPPSGLTASAEYAQLQAQRTEGKVSTEVYRAREAELANLIAEGRGEAPAPAAAAPGESHPYLTPPTDPNAYGLLKGVGDLPPEEVAVIHAQQDSLARLGISPAVVQDAASRLQASAAELANATPGQVESVIAGNYSRFIAQCAKGGVTAAEAESLIGEQLKTWAAAEPSLRPMLEAIARIGDPTTLDRIMQIAKFNRAASAKR